MTADLIGQKIRLVLTNNFHYSGKVINEDDKSIKIIDQKGSEVTISKFSIIIQEIINAN